MNKVLCFGSLNIDYTYRVPRFVTPGETLSAASLQIFSGGKGLNQSIALARAGLSVSLAGAVGEDGLFLLDQLRAAGVDTQYVSILPGVRTGHAIIQNADSGENCILVFSGANRCTTREQADRCLGDYGRGDLLVLQNEINELAYLMRAAKERGMRIALTPAPMSDGVRSLPLDTVDYLFLNETEAGRLLDGEADPEHEPIAAAELLRRRFSPRAVILTLGAEGSVYVDGEKTLPQAAFPAKAVDTTGAGDTFTGYFLAGLLDGLEEEKAMSYASCAAAIAVTRKGASPSIPVKSEVLTALL